MSRKFHIRKTTRYDSQALARIQVDSYRSAYVGIFPQAYLDGFSYEEQTKDWQDLLAQEGGDVLLVAEAGEGRIVGYVLGRPGLTPIAPYDSELVALHVRREAQGEGVGKALVCAMAERLQKQGCESMILWVLEKNPARAFYDRLGGRIIGEQVIHPLEDDFQLKEVAYGWADIADLVDKNG